LRIAIYLLILLLLFISLNAQETQNNSQKESLAVISFSAVQTPGTNMSSMLEIQTISELVTDEVKKALKKNYLLAIDAKLKSLLKINKLPQSGIITNHKALSNIGKAISVNLFIMGSVEKGNKDYLIKIKLVKATTSSVKELSFSMKEISDLEKQQLSQKLNSLVASMDKKKAVVKATVHKKKSDKKVTPKSLKKEPVKSAIAPTKPATKIRPYKWYSIGCWAAGGVSILSGLIFGAKSASKEDDFNRFFNQGDKTRADTARKDSNRFESLSIGSYVAAGILTAAGTALFFITEDTNDKSYSFDLSFDNTHVLFGLNYNF